MHRILIFLILAVFCRVGHAQTPLMLNLNGVLDAPKIQVIKDQLDQSGSREIILHLDSWEGDLKQALAFAQHLNDLKISRNLKIISYVENRAIGAAAVFPFLADQWIGTPMFSWGDIIYNSPNAMSQEQLRNSLFELIPKDSPKRQLLQWIAQAMIDPTVELVDQDGWKLISSSTFHHPLVLDEKKLLEMGFAVEILLPHAFHQNYGSLGLLPSSMQNLKADRALAAKIHYDNSGNNLVGYLYIGPDRPIDQSTYLQVKFALEEYRKRNVIFVLLHLDTPGGEVFPSMKIADLLQKMDSQYHIPVVAMIHNWALSAGAMLAYSCRFIAVTGTSLMGAAEPVFAGGEGKMETAPEKIVSALRAEFASLAKFWGRNPLVAEAMVDKDMFLIRRNGQFIQLDSEQQLQAEGMTADEVISAKGKLLTLDADQLLKYGIADFDVPITATREVTPLEKKLGEWPAEQSQLFNYPFFAKIPQATLVYYHDWKIGFFAFLTHPFVSSLLMMGLIIGIYMEMSHPGLGFPAIIALLCLALIVLSHFATQTIDWLEILIVALGLILLLAEIFILPGFGIIGILGILCIVGGLIAMLLPSLTSVHFAWDWRDWNLPAIEFVEQLGVNVLTVVIALITIAFLARFVSPRILKRSRVVLETTQEGNIAGHEPQALPAVGTEGEAFTSLRPGGKILIQNHLYNALTEGNFIEQGQKVVVSKIQGSVIIVAKKSNSPDKNQG